ncbi:hypothetical protein Hanom_Chr06g00551341 [Helianthus anomalus]
MHDNNELRQARMTIQELVDEKNRLESQFHAAGVRESRFLLEKNKAEDDLKRVTVNLAEERIVWARDIAKKERIISRAKTVQEELERKAVHEAQKERYQDLTLHLEASEAKVRDKQVELEDREEKLRKLQQICDALVTEKNQLLQASSSQQSHLKEAESALDHTHAEVDSLTSHLAGLQSDRNWLISQGLFGAFEYLRRSEPFVALLDRLSTAAYKSGQHDGVYEGYVNCHQISKVTPEFQEVSGNVTADMEDALEAVYNDSLSAYADLTSKVVEDVVESLRHMLEVVEESKEE